MIQIQLDPLKYEVTETAFQVHFMTLSEWKFNLER